MNSKHAIGFMVMGAVLGGIPLLAPGWCPVDGVDGSSTRGLWLELMSTLQLGIAMTFFAGRILASLSVLMETTVRATEPAFELPAWSPAEEMAGTVPGARRRRADIVPMPVGLDSGLIETRRAA